jgi:hypothetical protein
MLTRKRVIDFRCATMGPEGPHPLEDMYGIHAKYKQACKTRKRGVIKMNHRSATI